MNLDMKGLYDVFLWAVDILILAGVDMLILVPNITLITSIEQSR